MEVKQTGKKSKRKQSVFFIYIFLFFFFFAKRPTWQRFCISDLPSACQPSSSGNIAKKHKNKLLAIAAVPMGTGPQRVCPLRHSSAQTAREPRSPATRSRHLHCGAGGGGGGPLAGARYQRRAISCEKCHMGRGQDQDSWDDGPAVLVRTTSSPP